MNQSQSMQKYKSKQRYVGFHLWPGAPHWCRTRPRMAECLGSIPFPAFLFFFNFQNTSVMIGLQNNISLLRYYHLLLQCDVSKSNHTKPQFRLFMLLKKMELTWLHFPHRKPHKTTQHLPPPRTITWFTCLLSCAGCLVPVAQARSGVRSPRRNKGKAFDRRNSLPTLR